MCVRVHVHVCVRVRLWRERHDYTILTFSKCLSTETLNFLTLALNSVTLAMNGELDPWWSEPKMCKKSTWNDLSMI